MIVIGGEDINLSNVETNIGFVYDPTTNSWSTQLTEAFGGGNVGDSMGIVLQDGTFVLSNIRTTNMESFDGPYVHRAQPDRQARSQQRGGLAHLRNGTLLTVDTAIASSFEIYNPTTNTWGNSGATPVNLADTAGLANSQEIGPGLLRPDGVLVYFSGNSLARTPAMTSPPGPGRTPRTWISRRHFAVGVQLLREGRAGRYFCPKTATSWSWR